jgi:Fur family ferric uptake transcriptional regulator
MIDRDSAMSEFTHYEPDPYLQSSLQKNGIRKTQARKVILQVMSQSPGHLSVEDIYLLVHEQYPNIGLTTVYRTLNILSQLGLVCRFDFGDGKARFELLDKPGGYQHHHHLVCLSCRNVYDYTDFLEEELELAKKTETSLAQKYNFLITNHIMRFYGFCESCRRARMHKSTRNK